MITFSEYEGYFKGMASVFKPIGHTEEMQRFALMDIDDILSAQKSGLDFTYPCMILENPEGKLTYKNEALLDENLGAFILLQNVFRNDPATKRETMDRLKKHGLEILSKIFFEKKMMLQNGATPPNSFVSHFDFSQVNYNIVGPIFSQCHGWRFEFNLGRQSKINLDPQNWT